MSPEANKEAVRRWYEDGYGKGDLDAIDEVIAPEMEVYSNGLEPGYYTDTPEKTKAYVRMWRDAFSDLSCSVGNLIAEGDQVCVEVTFEGTHDGPYVMGGHSYPPTGNRCRITLIHTVRVAGGKAVEARMQVQGYGDMIRMLDGSAFKER